MSWRKSCLVSWCRCVMARKCLGRYNRFGQLGKHNIKTCSKKSWELWLIRWQSNCSAQRWFQKSCVRSQRSSVVRAKKCHWFGVVDVGIAQTLKALTGHNYQKWLDEGDNVEIWFGHQKDLTAMERWILITQWVRNAWQELCGSKYDHLRKRCWEKPAV